MLRFAPQRPAGGRLAILALGAHADDIEIGAGGTILRLLGEAPRMISVRWVVLSATGARETEAHAGATAFLADAGTSEVSVASFRDGFFPSDLGPLKEYFETIKATFTPDIVLAHHRGDAHQDHRLVGELAWQTFREHVILEYEVPKYDGDLGRPNVYVPLTDDIAARKIELLMAAYPSQRQRHWFTEDTFGALLRLRGIECGPGVRTAEAFHASKLVL